MITHERLYEVIALDLDKGFSATASDSLIRVHLKQIGGPVSDIRLSVGDISFVCSPKTLDDEGIKLGSFFRMKFSG